MTNDEVTATGSGGSGDEPERFFFVHLQKTAGTSLFRRLQHHFGADAVYPTPEHQHNADAIIDVDYLRGVFETEGDRIRVVTGHFPYCTAEVLGVPFRTFTVLRDPVERTLSFLRHQRKLDPALADATLEEIYEVPLLLHGLIHQHMVKMLALTPESMTAGALTMAPCDESWLRRAEETLDRIDVVGVQEDFDGFCDALAERFDLDLGPAQVTNATVAQDVDPAFAARIARDNHLDVELHRYATERWARR